MYGPFIKILGARVPGPPKSTPLIWSKSKARDYGSMDRQADGQGSTINVTS